MRYLSNGLNPKEHDKMYEDKSDLRLSLFISPTLRFIMELTCWIWLLIAGLTINIIYLGLFLLSVSLMATLNFPGDKKHDGPVSIPGWLRIFNELMFAGLLGIFGSFLLFEINGIIIQSVIVILVIIFDFSRYLWMLGFKNNPPKYVSYWKNTKN